MKTQKELPNRLAGEKSPYLLQHAYNPVDWYPWRGEAFEQAKKVDKPVLLSIGYSTCHWCHVMERESFEDQEVADLLNRYFIPVKVDREERPDVDQLYMTYCQAMTGAGGWPLTVIMTPDQKPFFTGTYFPKTSRYGRPGMMELLGQIGELWSKDRGKIQESAEELYQQITLQYQAKGKAPQKKLEDPDDVEEASPDELLSWGQTVLRKGYALLANRFDPQYGGFGSAPKFPTPHQLGFLLRYHLVEGDGKSLAMVERTLEAMADGGIFDHLGFGFARYSTDQYWLVPHFEKMLYDNAGLAVVYLEAYQLTRKERYGQIAREIFHYILRDMTSPEGAFYSAEDADSEGVEGKYYVWDEGEIRKILQPLRDQAVSLYCEAYGINETGHYEGKNIPSRIFYNREDMARRYGLGEQEVEDCLKRCNQILFLEREKRVRPAKDDKILVSWNGLMIAALAKGAQAFLGDPARQLERETFLQAGEKAVGFILKHMVDESGRLLARYREGHAAYLAYLDDYAFLIYGLLELYTACGKAEYLHQALQLQEEQERLFRAEAGGGYYFTGHDAEALLIRTRELYDGAMPSGNAISAFNLARLWRMTGEPRWQEMAQQQMTAFQREIEDYPAGYTAFLQGIQYLIDPGEELVLTGSLQSKEMAQMQAVFLTSFHPFSAVLYQEGNARQLVPRLKDYPVKEQVFAYYCRGFACQEPVSEPEKLKDLLSKEH